MITPDRLQKRSWFLQAVRSFFISRGYLEVDTPIRLPTPLPEANIIPFSSEGWFLQSSPEQCMKRLLAAGNTQLFQICHCFRQEESGRYHQTEFTMLEWYHAGWSYVELMNECEEFLLDLVRSVPEQEGIKNKDSLTWKGRDISITSPWEELTVAQAFEKYAEISVTQALAQDMFDQVLVTQIEPHLGWDTPLFLYDYPVELGSLARNKPENEKIAERFELYIGGIELANGFSELTDPVEQRKRFLVEMQKAKELDTDYPALPEKFLADLAGLQDTAGVALGLDRLFMILLGCDTVKEAMCMFTEDL